MSTRLLHHPEYRERYQANLKRDLPRLPYAPDFWGFAKAGGRLGEIHIAYEEVPEYPLHFIENREVSIDWRVEKMKLSKDKTQLVYNDFLTLDGIPAKAFNYRLGNRSALEWVIDQYIASKRTNGVAFGQRPETVRTTRGTSLSSSERSLPSAWRQLRLWKACPVYPVFWFSRLGVPSH